MAKKKKHPKRVYLPDILLKLGYHSYAQYLKSSLWQHITKLVKKRFNYKCMLCGKPSTCVHHTTYYQEVMAGNSIESLAALCENCHTDIHFFPNGKKRRSFKKIQIFASTCGTF